MDGNEKSITKIFLKIHSPVRASVNTSHDDALRLEKPCQCVMCHSITSAATRPHFTSSNASFSGSRDEVSPGKRWSSDQLWEKGTSGESRSCWAPSGFCRRIKTALDKVITVKWRSKPRVPFWFPLLLDFMSALVKSELWLTGRWRTGQRRKRRIGYLLFSIRVTKQRKLRMEIISKSELTSRVTRVQKLTVKMHR